MTEIYLDTGAFPVFATKKAILREILAECHNSPAMESIVFRLNNTDLTGLADGDSIFNPADTFSTANA